MSDLYGLGMTTGAVRLLTVGARPTAVVAQTTTWSEFPKLWGPLLGQVYEFVRARPELADRTPFVGPPRVRGWWM